MLLTEFDANRQQAIINPEDLNEYSWGFLK